MSMGRVNCHTHAANDNGRCPVIGCHYTAGTACTAWLCPGRKFKNTAPRSSRQPTLVSGCEGHPAASDKRRGDRRQHTTLRMDGNGETFFHGETCA